MRLADGRIAAVWSDTSDSISWRLGCELDLTITENSHTSSTANVTVEARDRHDNRLVRVGKVLVDGVAAGSLNQPFDYERRLDLVCELGTCTPVFRPRTFRVTADGCTAAESSHI